jgi:hypothetical protein
VVCRPGSGDACDPDERCTGIVGQGCPPDVVAPPTTVCRPGSGDSCDPAETCTAIPQAPCPANTNVAPAGTVCRPAAGTCDVAEQCTGNAGQSCPADGFALAGAPCDLDNNVCTDDQCNGSGACAAVGVLDCEDGNICTQDSCDPDMGCVSTGTPSTGCVPAVKASFQMRDSANDLVDRLKFNWRGGPVLLPDMGDPTDTTRYELCVYDSSGVRFAVGVPPGSGWSLTGSPSAPKGYRYKSRTGDIQGVTRIDIRGSSLPKGKAKVSGKGGQLPYEPVGPPLIPFSLPVTTQLYASDGACWEAEFGVGETRRNADGLFSGKAQAP